MMNLGGLLNCPGGATVISLKNDRLPKLQVHFNPGIKAISLRAQAVAFAVINMKL